MKANKISDYFNSKMTSDRFDEVRHIGPELCILKIAKRKQGMNVHILTQKVNRLCRIDETTEYMIERMEVLAEAGLLKFKLEVSDFAPNTSIQIELVE